MNSIKQISKNVLIYSLLIIGFMYLYLVDIDVLLHPQDEIQPRAKVNFIYQQF